MIAARHFLVLGTFLLAILLYVDRVCISTAQDQITFALELSGTEFGWVLSSFALGYALGQIPAGMLADRYGPRLVLAAIVTIWSLFTGLTGVVTGLASLLVARFLFGVGEAGAFPGMARAIYAWVPASERGLAQGINFSGGRLGAAFALPAIAALVELLGWRGSFVVLMLIGFVWAVLWFLWFRDEPAQVVVGGGGSAAGATQRLVSLAEKSTGGTRVAPMAVEPMAVKPRAVRVATLMRSGNLRLLMLQYFCSNFTFFFCLSWLFPHLKKTYQLDAVTAGWYASAPLVCGALGHFVAGWLVDRIYRTGQWTLSRRLPAGVGFLLAAGGLVASVFMDDVGSAVTCLSIAIFGADMTISPSWAACVDIGRHNSGAVSGTMNMAGNVGSFVTSLAFPYLLVWTGSVDVFFYTGAALNVLASLAWLFVRPDQTLESEAK